MYHISLSSLLICLVLSSLILCTCWLLCRHLDYRFRVNVGLWHSDWLSRVHRHRNCIRIHSWPLVGDSDLFGIFGLHTAHELLDVICSLAAGLLMGGQELVQHLHSCVDPSLLHLDLLIELHDLLHQLHHCKVLQGDISVV